MPDFKSHLPVQTHKDGATFTPSSHYVVGVGGYESVAGTVLMAGVTANREWLVTDTNFASVVFLEDDASASGHAGLSILSVRQDTLASSTSTDGDYQDIKSDSLGRVYTRDASVYSEDTAHATGDLGCFILGVRNDTLGTLAGTDGDYAPVQFNASGELYVHDTDANTSLSSIVTSVQLIDDIIYAEDTAHSSGASGAFILAVRNDAGTALAGTDGDYIPLTTDAAGKLWTNTSLPDITHAEDAAHVSGDKGVMFLAVRNDAGTVLAGTDGDYIPVSTDKYGALRVTVVDPTQLSTEVNPYNTSAAVAVAASVNHNYTVTALKLLKIKWIMASASGRIKVVVILDPAGANATKFTMFNSTANPNIMIPVDHLIEVAAGLVVRITITNLDEDAQDVYSTLLGNEI